MIIFITKYNLSPKWFQLLTFLTIYFLLIKIQTFDQTIVVCMLSDSNELEALCDHRTDTKAQKLIVNCVQPSLSIEDRLWLTEYINEISRTKASLKHYFNAYEQSEARVSDLLERATTAEAFVTELQEFKATTENYMTELHRLNAELLEERNLNTPSYIPRCYHIGAACGACTSGCVQHCVLHCCIIS